MATTPPTVIRPIDAFVKYFLDVKPYHTKILEVVERYNFAEEMTVNFAEASFTKIIFKNQAVCNPVGFGISFDDSCGYSSVSCCDMFDCIGGYGLIYDNSDLLVSTPVLDANLTEDWVYVQGNQTYDFKAQILSAIRNTFTVSGNLTSRLQVHNLFLVTPFNVATLTGTTTTSFIVAGDHAAEFNLKREFQALGTNANDGMYAVTKAIYSPYLGTTEIIVSSESPNPLRVLAQDITGYLETYTPAHNMGAYQVKSIGFDGTNTIVEILADTSLFPAGVGGALQLRTGLLNGRHVYLRDAVETSGMKEYKIIASEFDIAANLTKLTFAEFLTVNNLGGGDWGNVNLYGYMTASGFDNDEECPPSREYMIGVNFYEKLSIAIVLPPSPTPTSTVTPTPTPTITPTISHTPTITPSITPSASAPSLGPHYTYAIGTQSPDIMQVGYGYIDSISGLHTELAQLQYAPTISGATGYNPLVATNTSKSIFMLDFETFDSGLSRFVSTLHAFQPFSNGSMVERATFSSPRPDSIYNAMAVSGNTLHMIEGFPYAGGFRNTGIMSAVQYDEPSTTFSEIVNYALPAIKNADFSAQSSIILHNGYIIVSVNSSTVQGTLYAFSYDGVSYTQIATHPISSIYTSNALSSDGTYIYIAADDSSIHAYQFIRMLTFNGSSFTLIRDIEMDNGVLGVSGGGMYGGRTYVTAMQASPQFLVGIYSDGGSPATFAYDGVVGPHLCGAYSWNVDPTSNLLLAISDNAFVNSGGAFKPTTVLDYDIITYPNRGGSNHGGGIRICSQLVLDPAPTPTPTPTITVTPTITPTITVTPTITPTISVTPTVTPTISITPTVTPTPSPSGVADPSLYVQTSGTPQIKKYNASTGGLITTITISGANPHQALSITPDGSFIFDGSSTTTHKITTSSNFGLLLSGVPEAVDSTVKPDGTKWYSIDQDNLNLNITDTSTNANTAVAIDGFPANIAVSPNGTRVYISGTGTTADSVTVFNTGSNTIVTTVAVLDGSFALTYLNVSADNSKVYIVNTADSILNILTTASNTISGTTIPISFDPQGLCLNLSGSKLYSLGGSTQDITVIDTSTDTVTNTVATGHNLSEAVLSQDGSTLYISAGDRILTFDTASETVTSSTFITGLTGARSMVIKN
jgi:hypothetical protein